MTEGQAAFYVLIAGMFRWSDERCKMARIIILAARNFEFRTQQGEVIKGIKAEGSEEEVSRENDYRGSGAVEYRVSEEAWNTLKHANLPGVFDVTVGLVKSKNAKGASVAVASIKGCVELAPIDVYSFAPVKRAA